MTDISESRANIKITKDELFDIFIFEFIIHFFEITKFQHPKYLIIFQIGKF